MTKEASKKSKSSDQVDQAKDGAFSVGQSNEPKQEKKLITEFKLSAGHLRIAPRKVRLVTDLIKGLNLQGAEEQLAFLPKKAAVYLKKILKNAQAIASHNYNLAREDLYIKNILVNQGPTLHRFKPAAYGMVHPIRKRSTNLILTIAKKDAGPTLPKSQKNIIKKIISRGKSEAARPAKAKK